LVYFIDDQGVGYGIIILDLKNTPLKG